MMPIVFCASLPPWPSEYKPALTNCRRRNRLSTFEGELRRQSQATATINKDPSKKPMVGEIRMKATVFTSPEAINGALPALAMVAPTMPPIKACELLEGMPYHQVITFQAMAPMSAPKITCWSTTPGSTMPLPTVAATLSWNTKMATTLKKAAKATACCGLSTPVDTTVAMELAAS